MNNELIIKEIYKTLQGEGPSTGRPATLVRLSGCSLRCQYCDSEYAFTGGNSMTVSEILDKVKEINNPLVLITGGEPVDQENLPDLLTELLSHDYEVELETAGHKSLEHIPSGVRIFMDVKTPGSGMQKHFHKGNLALLDEQDILKFIITSRDDYDWAKKWLNNLDDSVIAHAWFSATNPVNANETEKISHEGLKSSDLANWILEDNLAVRFQLQLHKIVWGAEKSR